jgi:hypothetical protein
MEDELFRSLYQLITREASLRPRRKRVWYSDALVLMVFFWAVLHDRPISWACRSNNWPAAKRDHPLPSPATMSRRMRNFSTLYLLQMLLASLPSPVSSLLQCVDAKPLVVGGFSKDPDAKWGQAVDAKAKGYKLFTVWSPAAATPTQWLLGPMNQAEPLAAATMIRRLQGGGYILGDCIYDTNALHQLCRAGGFQLLSPRKKPGTQLGHQTHDPARLRSIELLELRPALPIYQASLKFGPSLYACRTAIERKYGHLGNFGGGLAPLPNWVRRPHRIAPWLAAKLLINALWIKKNPAFAA